MASARLTIRDVAGLAGVSRQTVSRVINDDPHISPSTRERVLRTIEDVGFVPSHAARSLATNRTHMAGFIVGDVGNPYFADVIRGAEAALTPLGWSLVLANTDFNPEKEMGFVDRLLSRAVDGLIVCDTSTSVEELATVTGRTGVPVVLLNRTSGPVPYAHMGVVRTDTRGAVRQAIAHLAGCGHRRIGFLVADRSTFMPGARLEAYRSSLADLRIPYEESLVIRGKLSIEGGRQAGHQLLRLSDRPTAVLCHSDQMAMGLIRACAEESVRVPRDLSIIGWDDIPFASAVTPPLTAIRVPRFDLGRSAGEMLVKLIKGEQAEMDVELPLTLVHRESCCLPGQ